jgi:hypothetical protein
MDFSSWEVILITESETRANIVAILPGPVRFGIISVFEKFSMPKVTFLAYSYVKESV